MTPLEQIQQDIQTLPPEALSILNQFIGLLKKTVPSSQAQDEPLPKTTETTDQSVYEKFQASGLIGCVSVDENLSTTYKQVLAEDWANKHGSSIQRP